MHRGDEEENACVAIACQVMACLQYLFDEVVLEVEVLEQLQLAQAVGQVEQPVLRQVQVHERGELDEGRRQHLQQVVLQHKLLEVREVVDGVRQHRQLARLEREHFQLPQQRGNPQAQRQVPIAVHPQSPELLHLQHLVGDHLQVHQLQVEEPRALALVDHKLHVLLELWEEDRDLVLHVAAKGGRKRGDVIEHVARSVFT